MISYPKNKKVNKVLISRLSHLCNIITNLIYNLVQKIKTNKIFHKKRIVLEELLANHNK
jgi:hypothetical protein